jgi:hypothetical protein
MQCYDGRAADGMAKENQTSSTKQGTDVGERLQRREWQCSIEFTVLSLKVFVFDTATFVKYAKETIEIFKTFLVWKCVERFHTLQFRDQ